MFLWAAMAAADSGVPGEILVSPETCVCGEEVQVEWVGAEGWKVSWAAPLGVLEDPEGPTTVYRCPEVDCPGESVEIYAVVYDEDNNQRWLFTEVDVRCRPPKEEACGCATQPPTLALLLGALGWVRLRAKRPGS